MKTAEIAIIFITGTLTLLVFVIFLVLIAIEYRKRQLRHITEKLELKHHYQNEVLQTQIEVQEQSFKYLSEEIHDNIAQTLSLVKLKLYRSASKAKDKLLRAEIENTNELLGSTLEDLRNLSHVLNGGLVSKLSLRESIEKELNYVHDVNNLDAQLTISGIYYEPNSEKKLLIFRIVQEAVSNAIKHGKATQIVVGLTYKQGIFTVQITDNGKGFDVSKIGQSKGLGLHNIFVRAKLLGTITINSEEQQGTSIVINIDTNER